MKRDRLPAQEGRPRRERESFPGHLYTVETFDREGDKNFLRRRRDLRAKDFSGLATGAADSLDVCRERSRIGRELGVAERCQRAASPMYCLGCVATPSPISLEGSCPDD